MPNLNLGTFVQVFLNGVDITDVVVSYTRDQSLCTGIGTCTLTLANADIIPDTWGVVKIKEGVLNRGTYFVSKIEVDAKDGSLIITAQDGSKLLTDYFLEDEYEVLDGDKSSKWVEFILDLVGINYIMPRGSGVELSSTTTIGLTSAYDALIQLLQYSGWYMVFDADNTLFVGSMVASVHNPVILDDTTLLNIQEHTSDQSLRNRAVVWGSSDPVTGYEVFADYSTRTRWNYGPNDLRAIVYSNPHIKSNDEASKIARMLLRYFARLDNIKEATVAGSPYVSIGTYVYINSMFYSGRGLITTYSVSMSSGGLTTNLKLDEKCPRLFAFISDYTDYVYIGTDNSGVWRKELSGAVWEEFNAGLAKGSGALSYGISDLYIANDVFSLTNYSGENFIRDFVGEWTKFTPSGIFDVSTSGEIFSTDMFGVATTIEHFNNHIFTAFNASGVNMSGCGGFVIETLPYSLEQLDYSQVYIAESGIVNDYNLSIVSIDTADTYNILTVATSGTANIIPVGPDGYIYGTCLSASSESANALAQRISIEDSQYTGLPTSGYTVEVYNATVGASGYAEPNVITEYLDDNNINIYHLQYSSGSTKVVKYNFADHSSLSTVIVAADIVSGGKSFIWKDTTSVIYTTDLVYSGGAYSIVRYITNLGTAATTSNILKTYPTTVATITLAQNGGKIFALYRDRTVATLTDTFSMDTFDIITGAVTTAWSVTSTYNTRTTYETTQLFPKINTGVMFHVGIFLRPTAPTHTEYIKVLHGDELSATTTTVYADTSATYDIGELTAGTMVSKQSYITGYMALLSELSFYTAPGVLSKYVFVSDTDGATYITLNTEPVFSFDLAGVAISNRSLDVDVYACYNYISPTETYLDFRNYITAERTSHVQMLSNTYPIRLADDISDLFYASYGGRLAAIDLAGEVQKVYYDVPTSSTSQVVGRFVLRNVSSSNSSIYVQYLKGGIIDNTRDAQTYKVLRQDGHTYTVIWDTPVETYVNCGPTIGTVVHSRNVPYSGIYGPSGVSVQGYLAASLTDTANSFTELTSVPSGITQARVFDYYYPTSGWYMPLPDRSDIYNSYIGIAGSGIIGMSGLGYSYIDLYNNQIGMIALFDYNTVHIETTNNLSDQYIFTTLYDTVSSGWYFYQKYPTAPAFAAYSGGFVSYSALPPESNITIIRVDDSL